MTPERREMVREGFQKARTGWRESWRELLWFFGALDEKGNPSATMFFAVALGITVVRHQWVDPEPTGWDIAQTALVGAIMFGRHTFERWLATKQVTGTVADVKATVRTIEERKDFTPHAWASGDPNAGVL